MDRNGGLVSDSRDATTRELFAQSYDELRAMANSCLQRAHEHDVPSAALVHEAYLRLTRGSAVEFRNVEHFRAATGKAMRHALIDHARRQGRRKRGAGRQHRSQLDDVSAPARLDETELLALAEALRKLSRLAARRGRIVKLRYLAGLSIDETARMLGVSDRTIDTECRAARAWLARELA